MDRRTLKDDCSKDGPPEYELYIRSVTTSEAERTGGTAPVPAESVADLLQEIEQVEQTAAEAKAHGLQNVRRKE